MYQLPDTRPGTKSLCNACGFFSKSHVLRIELCKKRVNFFIFHLQRPSTKQSSCKENILMRFTPNSESKISQQIRFFSLERNNQPYISYPYQEKHPSNTPHNYENIFVTLFYFQHLRVKWQSCFFLKGEKMNSWLLEREIHLNVSRKHFIQDFYPNLLSKQ